jgi:hypothetical protein
MGMHKIFYLANQFLNDLLPKGAAPASSLEMTASGKSPNRGKKGVQEKQGPPFEFSDNVLIIKGKNSAGRGQLTAGKKGFPILLLPHKQDLAPFTQLL